MSLSIYLDECSDDNLLIALLRHAGHVVVSPRQAGTVGWNDPNHLEYAAQHGYTLLTKNPDVFQDLHNLWQIQGRPHAGILLVYQDNDLSKDMTVQDLVRALEKLLASGLPVANDIQVLNHWR
jgi:hypothetical protein